MQPLLRGRTPVTVIPAAVIVTGPFPFMGGSLLGDRLRKRAVAHRRVGWAPGCLRSRAERVGGSRRRDRAPRRGPG
jgi:hypothetical protein